MLEFSNMDTDHIHLKINMKCMFILGLFKFNFKNRIANFLYNNVYSKLALCYLTTFVIAQYIEMYNTLDEELYHVMSILGVALLYTVTIPKIYVCKSALISKLVKQIRSTEISVMNYNNKHIKDIYYSHVRWNHAADKLYIWVGAISVPPFFINPVLLQMTDDFKIEKERLLNLTEHIARPLPFSTWFPLDKERFYYLVYVYHSLAVAIGAALTVSVAIFYVGLITFAVGQIKILQYSFRNTNLLAENLAKNNPGLTQEEAIKITIHHFIHMHRVIIQYVWTMDSAMSKLMLFEFFIASLQMATLGIQIVVSEFGVTQMFAIEYLGAMLIQLLLVYWSANELMFESLGIAHAVWESDWVNYSQDIKKTLMMIMMRAQKPMTISVGPFYEMSAQTALSVVRAACSYVAILRQVYMRDTPAED